MKTNLKTYLLLPLLLWALNAHAQNTGDDVKKLIEQGIALNDAGKFTEAIEKYDEAIKLDPNSAKAWYEKGYTLFTSNKRKDAIPVLEKLLEINPKAGGGYDLLGTIYDDDNQTDKAIDYYKKGTEADPEYQRLHFNLAIAYYKQGKLAEAEESALTAIKLEPKHASSIRVYAMVTYREQKRGTSLLAWCNFLTLEPRTQRSLLACKYVNNILNYGISRTDEKNVKMNVSTADISSGNMTLQLAVVAATSKKTDLKGIDSLSLQLSSAFSISTSILGDKPTDYAKHLAKYFNDLEKTDNVPAFARLISVTVYKEEDEAWLKEHQKELDAIDKWLKDEPRDF